jgi:hypothetical protein
VSVSRLSIVQIMRNYRQFQITALEEHTMHCILKIGLTYVEQDLGATVVAILDNYKAKPAILTEPVYCIAGIWSSGEFVQEIERQLGERVSLITTSTCRNPYLDHTYRSFNAWGVALDVNLPHPSHTLLGIELHTLEDYVREDILPFVQATETLRIP